MSAFWHRGEVGDVLYALSMLSHKPDGPHTLYLRRQGIHEFNQFDALKRLIEAQPYIKELVEMQDCPGDVVNLRGIIDGPSHGSPSIIRPYFAWAGMPFFVHPWLHGFTLRPEGKLLDDSDYCTINVTMRYRAENFNWGAYLPAGRMHFLGLELEYNEFLHHLKWSGYAKVAERVHYVRTPDFYSVAEQLAGSRAFFGNASACLAVAQGIGLRRIYVEATDLTATTCLFGNEHILSGVAHVV